MHKCNILFQQPKAAVWKRQLQFVEKVYYRKKLHKIKVYVHAFQRVVGVQRAKPLVASAEAKYLKLTAPNIAAIVKYL